MRDTLFDPLELIDMKIDSALASVTGRFVDDTSLANLKIKGIPLDGEEFVITGFSDNLPLSCWCEGTIFNRQIIREVLYKLYDKYLQVYPDITFELFEQNEYTFEELNEGGNE